MSRKAVNGYPEKSYYDNTIYEGVSATGGPLNEGSFALITNFNIIDSNRSVTPRDGYLTTTFAVDGEDVILSDKVLVYRDPSIQQNVIIDLSKAVNEEQFAYLVNITPYDVNTDDKKVFEGKVITNYDTEEFLGILRKLHKMARLAKEAEDAAENEHFDVPVDETIEDSIMLSTFAKGLSIIGSPLLQPIKDLDNVTYYITKLQYKDIQCTFKFWIKVLYREKSARNMSDTTKPLPADTLVVSIIDTTQQSKKPEVRNIASPISVIPELEKMRTQDAPNTDGSEVTDIPTAMLVCTPEGYVTNFIHEKYRNDLSAITLHPVFHLQDPSKILNVDIDEVDTCKWAFRFDVINTAIDAETLVRFKTPWRKLPVDKTTSGDCEIIEELNIIGQDIEELEEYIYYVVPHSSCMYVGHPTETSHYDVELDVSEIFTYTEHEILEFNRIKNDPSKISRLINITKRLRTPFINEPFLENIETDIYEDERYIFISQEEMEGALYPTEEINGLDNKEKLINGNTRVLQFTKEESAREIFQQYGAEAEVPVHAPCFVLDKNKYESFFEHSDIEEEHRSFETFKKQAIKKGKNYKIKIIFLPFARFHEERFYSTESGASVLKESIGVVCLMSAGGIYMTGMKLVPGALAATLPSWASIKNTRTYNITNTLNNSAGTYQDYFSNLNNLCLGDVLTLAPREVFRNGITVMMYLRPYKESELDDIRELSVKNKDLKITSWDASSFSPQIANVSWAPARDVVYVEEVDKENPEVITNTNNTVVFEDRLVVWSGNKVYLSDEGVQYFFNKTNIHIFPEEVLKVIAFKTILLVFTTQNLYAIYRVEEEVETTQQDEEGKALTTVVTRWFNRCVLYNINADRKYLDAIQVYNQMILFYSSEGQLYMIKPSATIDSETQFGIQYFNKSANHILENYEEYINMRLQTYGKLDVNKPEDYVTKEQVDIKVLLDIDTIKIFYSVPGRIVFILIYDVVNNRYYTYDTLSFNDVKGLWHAEGGEAYLTSVSKKRSGGNTYFTVPVKSKLGMDQNADMHYERVFKKEPIFALIDTGNLNLNTHLTKRMRDLRITLKNLDATKILYNAEVMMDDTIVRPMYAPDFKVKMTNGPSYTMATTETPQEDIDELFGLDQTLGQEGTRKDINSFELHHDKEFFEKNTLLKTETINSSKLIEYNSSILSMGKNVRLKMQFISKGKYKLQSFGIIYKERHV